MIMYLHYQIMRGYYVYGLDLPSPFGDMKMPAQSLSEEIKSLEVFLGDEDGAAESVLYTIKTLNEIIEMLPNQNWDAATIKEHVLSDNDPLERVDGVSDLFRENVREVQHGIVNYYS